MADELKKYRRFRLLLYPEDLTHVSAMAHIMENFDKYAFILHDKDKDENGEAKKEHWHIVVEFKNPRALSGVAKELHITDNYIRVCDYFAEALEYLLHLKAPEKHQYDIDEVNGTLVGKLKDLMNKGQKSECEKVFDLLDFIEETTGYIKVSDFARHCAEVGTWDIFRRSSAIFLKAIEEHNHFSGLGSSIIPSK